MMFWVLAFAILGAALTHWTILKRRVKRNEESLDRLTKRRRRRH